uniref:(California timema) hypothetical protein n=1 Tax=Timema californicum TaxID=61474 RepID=A0A7R9J0L0_TIMCA|nr:unnamed protein product [Timema californicum]
MYACKIKQDDKKENKKADSHKSEDTKTLPTFEEAFGSTEIGKFCNRVRVLNVLYVSWYPLWIMYSAEVGKILQNIQMKTKEDSNF